MNKMHEMIGDYFFSSEFLNRSVDGRNAAGSFEKIKGRSLRKKLFGVCTFLLLRYRSSSLQELHLANKFFEEVVKQSIGTFLIVGEIERILAGSCRAKLIDYQC